MVVGQNIPWVLFNYMVKAFQRIIKAPHLLVGESQGIKGLDTVTIKGQGPLQNIHRLLKEPHSSVNSP